MSAAGTGAHRLHAVRVHASDDVAVAVEALAPGDVVYVGEAHLEVRDAVPAGHKIALRAFDAGDAVRKYGWPIGRATAAIERGAWVHSHNLETRLDGTLAYTYKPVAAHTANVPAGMPTWQGFRRGDGRVGTRNEIWIINTVGCVNWAAEQIARSASERFAGRVDGVHAFAHPYGCSQLGDDLGNTRQVLAGLLRHPNAAGVLVLGLGCENNQLEALLSAAGEVDRSRIRFFNTQDVLDEKQIGMDMVELRQQQYGRKTPGQTMQQDGVAILPQARAVAKASRSRLRLQPFEAQAQRQHQGQAAGPGEQPQPVYRAPEGYRHHHAQHGTGDGGRSTGTHVHTHLIGN